MTRDDMSGSWLTGMTAGKSFRTPASRGLAQWKSRVVHWAWSGVARADTGMRSIGFEGGSRCPGLIRRSGRFWGLRAACSAARSDDSRRGLVRCEQRGELLGVGLTVAAVGVVEYDVGDLSLRGEGADLR